ncbi:hypothetical protein RAS12_08900 [Achromobacter seleniivolatilans]|uniref:Uncharacterized protein n=1 Tax=Achromobacter seleniivolatilans TaxID=3047478 RepID=A0ABY9M6N4_9BURK|nr:hypothetical protein [Achromobacter sp. R39]WMD22480.1 hypothetical protein RAS12_08900 [Achromobacter sp. R39]
MSLIKGDNVALSVGRDITLTSTSSLENHGATLGSYISGVSRVDADNLSMLAGRKLHQGRKTRSCMTWRGREFRIRSTYVIDQSQGKRVEVGNVHLNVTK